MSQSDAPLAQYSFRRSVLEGGKVYSVYPDRIEVDGGPVPRTHLLCDVRTVHLKYEHTKQREYYECYVHTTRGRISLRHLDWQGPMKFQDQRKTYTPFVKTLLAQLAQYPNVRYKAGSMANFLGAILGAPLMGGLGLLAHAHDRDGSAALAGLMMGICLLMIRPSRPRRFDPLAPPADLLP